MVHRLGGAHAVGRLCDVGVAEAEGRIGVRDDLFEPKGELRVESLRIGTSIWRRPSEEYPQPLAAD